MKFHSWLNVSIYLLSFGDINKSNSLPQKLKSQYAKRKMSWIQHAWRKIGVHWFFFIISKSVWDHSAHQYVKLVNFYFVEILMVEVISCLYLEELQSAVLHYRTLGELNFVDISLDWTCSSTRCVSLFLIRRWGRISQCCVVSEYWMK